MRKKSIVAIVIIIIVVILFLAIWVPNFTMLVRRFNLTKRSLEIVKPYEETAFEYVVKETNAVERYGYGKELDLKCDMRRIDYINDQDAHFTNLDEFENEVNTLEIYVSVNNRATCVVCFEKDEDGHLVITKHFWE